MSSTYKRYVLHTRPHAEVQPSNFKRETLPLSSLKPGPRQVLVQVTWVSLDPAMRGWLRETKSYMPPVQIGETMRASGLGVVVEAGEGSKWNAGEMVNGLVGWTEYVVLPDKELQPVKIPKGAEPIDSLHALGNPGLTAYFGLQEIGHLKPGETLLVSGAAGAVGSLACQIGRKRGARVFAIAGTPEKCTWLENELGVVKALNYKSPEFRKELKAIGNVDVYFDNVGGEILDMVLGRLNRKGRVVLCGAISDYNSPKPHGLSSYMTLISQRAKIEGFLVFDYVKQYPAAIAEIAGWIKDGSLKRKFHTVEGLDQAPQALAMLFSGANTGKLLVKVADVPKAKL